MKTVGKASDEHCLHHNRKDKNKISINIFTLYFSVIHEDSTYVVQKYYLSRCSVKTFKSRRHDVTSIEHYVDQ